MPAEITHEEGSNAFKISCSFASIQENTLLIFQIVISQIVISNIIFVSICQELIPEHLALHITTHGKQCCIYTYADTDYLGLFCTPSHFI
jgi:hypothetical protein